MNAEAECELFEAVIEELGNRDLINEVIEVTLPDVGEEDELVGYLYLSQM